MHEVRRRLTDWERTHYSPFPWRSTTNSFHALVAEIMLQRTRAEQVVPVYNTFTARYLSASEVVMGDLCEISKLLEPLGLRWRAKKIVALSKEIVRLGNRIPTTYDELIALPGVGFYVACAYLSFHLGIRAAIVDANAVRLWTRVFGLDAKKEMRRKKEFICLVDSVTPHADFKYFNYAVLDHTRLVCKQRPLCQVCPINSSCTYYLKLQLST